MLKTTIQRFPVLEGLMEHLNTPLFQNAYALIVNTGATSFLGLIYWKLAAQFYDPEVVGINSVIISMMVFLSGLSSLNLHSALNRFIPRTGKNTARFVLLSYLVTILVTCAVVPVFLFGQHALDPENSFLNFGTPFAISFLVANIIWVIFALQDNALIGLRKSIWVPLENISFSVGKIILLVLFVGLLPGFGLFASWVIPVALALIPVNYLIFRHLIPQHVKKTGIKRKPVQPREVVRYVSGDYVGQLMALASSHLLPFIVYTIVGAAAAAYFNIAWLIAVTPSLMATSMSQSLTVEGASDEQKLSQYTLSTLKQMGRILLPLILLLAVGAPLIMQIFGEEYAANGTTVFILLALACIPVALNILSVSIARVQQRIKHILMVTSASCFLSLGFAIALAGQMGLDGVGIAYLGSQTIVAIFLAIPLIYRVVRIPTEPDTEKVTA